MAPAVSPIVRRAVAMLLRISARPGASESGLLVERHGPAGLAGIMEQVGQGEGGVDVIRGEPEGRLQVGKALVEPAQFVQRDAEVGQGVGIIGDQAEGLAVGGGGLVEATQGPEYHAEVVPVIRPIGHEGDRLRDQPDGLVVASPLMLQDAQQVDGIGVLGPGGEEATIGRLGAVEIASLVDPDGGVEFVLGEMVHGVILVARSGRAPSIPAFGS